MNEENKENIVQETEQPATNEENIEEVKEFLIEKGTLKKYLGTDIHVLVPDEVVVIGDGAFKNQNKLISVTLPEDITSIGHYAFSGCRNLTSIEIPYRVTTIGDYAFKGCKRLPVIDIPESVRRIGRGAFDSTQLIIN